MSASIVQFPSFTVATAMPLPWRKLTNAHKQHGARAMRFPYTASQATPTVAAPALLNFRYDALGQMDRIIGFCLSIAASSTASLFTLNELNTGWVFAYNFPGGNNGAYMLNNIETLPDEVSLQWSFSADPGQAYVSFFNFEVVPFQTV